jgi:TonB family protein
MKKLILFSLLILFFHQSYAQTDTVFFNKNRKAVTVRREADYYRLIKPRDSVFNVTEYYLDGKVKMTGTLSSIDPIVYDGIITWYSEKGVLMSKGFLKNNKREDHLITYNPDGTIHSDALYKANKLDGQHTFYFPNMKVKRTDIYKEGEFISGKCYTPTGAETPYYPYIQNPEFTGGEEKLRAYMRTNLAYPKKAIREDISGIVKVKFTVTTAGEITDVRLENTIHPLLDNEALRLVQKMPRWKPGLLDNEVANVSLSLPVAFVLQD